MILPSQTQKAVPDSDSEVSVTNSYGHPSPEALALYANVGASVWRTDQNGTISFTVKFDGSYAISPERGIPLARAGRGVAEPLPDELRAVKQASKPQRVGKAR